MAAGRRSGLFKHVGAEELLRESNKSCFRAKGSFRVPRVLLRAKALLNRVVCNDTFFFSVSYFVKKETHEF